MLLNIGMILICIAFGATCMCESYDSFKNGNYKESLVCFLGFALTMFYVSAAC